MSPVDGASATLTIDLGALAANYRLLRARLGPGCQCAAVVKADAYGLGLGPVARRLAREGCGHFFVATLDEAAALRDALDQGGDEGEAAGAIYVLLGAEPDTAAGLAELGVIPVLNSREHIELWRKEAARRGAPLPAIVQVDTGMNRLGLEARDLDWIAQEPDALAGIEVRFVMSHLACADEPGHPLNQRQLDAFIGARATFPAASASLSNSGGILLGQAYHFDLVRPGIALYGGNPLAQGPNSFSEVVQLQTRIVQVREIDSPQAVGYGATHRVAGPCRIATVPVGYADGYLRSLGNRGTAFVAGVRAPLVGRVSMDLITLDVTAAPPEQTRPGAIVTLIGGGAGLDDLAREAGTISYEILTRLGPRLKRAYVN